jgi:phosphoglycolate phosphatase-like HAD superfamily hydrolase
MTEVRAIVLDFDGVVLESADIKTRAFGRLFEGEPEHTDAIVRLHLDNVGLPRSDKFRIIYRDILRRPLDETELERLGREFSDLVFEEILACTPVAGALEFLAAHASARLLFVASATPQDELREIVRQRRLEQYFRAVYGSPDGKAEILRRIMRDWELDPVEVVFVGDALADLEHAKAAGVQFIGRVSPGSESPFPASDGVSVVYDLAELAGFLPVADQRS